MLLFFAFLHSYVSYYIMFNSDFKWKKVLNDPVKKHNTETNHSIFVFNAINLS